MRRCFWAVAGLAVVLSPAAVQADVFGDVLLGLDFAGFQYTGQRNPLSGGFDIGAFRNFQNTQLDFGATELTLTGPVGASFTTGGRLVRTLDFNFNLGVPGNPLQYSYVSDIGANAMTATGSTILGVNGSINQFGWYDMQFQFSNRADINGEGRFTNPDGSTSDFDVGPINIRGNIYADLLAAITDPIFEQSGYENPFASFSGRTQRENALESTVSQLQAKAAAGRNLSEREVSHLVTLAMTSQYHGDAVPDLSFLHLTPGTGATGRAVGQTVPEPATLALLLPAAVYLLRRRRR